MQTRGYADKDANADADRISTKNNMSPPPHPMVGDITKFLLAINTRITHFLNISAIFTGITQFLNVSAL